MALSAARKQELARMTLPSDEEMRQRVRRFVGLSGMTWTEFASAVGYSQAAIHLFLGGRYGEAAPGAVDNSRAIRAAIKEYIDTHEIAGGFEFRGKHHATQSFSEVRRAALSALRKGTAYLLDGPPGTEKTWSLRQIEREVRENQLGRCVYVYARVSHSPQNFLREVCRSSDIPDRGTIDQLLRKIRFFLAAGRTLLMVDEAQHLDHAGLEVLRQLLDLPPYFGVILAGSHDLTQRLSHWQMEQWRSRVRKTFYLNGPTEAECRAILRAELGPMSDTACNGVIANCRSSAQRVEVRGGKPVAKPFDYISARDLFNAIEHTRDLIHAAQPEPIQKGAA